MAQSDAQQLALKEHDEKQLYVSRQHLHDLRSIYAILTDILHKNIEKVTSYVRSETTVPLTTADRSARRRATTQAQCISHHDRDAPSTDLLTYHAQQRIHAP